jgi:nicotinamidase/pyrazinamidase
MIPMQKTALLLVDIQNDFCNGSLAVPHAQEIISVVNNLTKKFEYIIATQDWHPADHLSFAVNHKGKQIGEIIDLEGVEQILWPAHCVQHSFGAQFHPQLNVESISKIFQKGTDRTIDSYSAFFDNAKKNSTGLHDYLQREGFKTLFIVGLATDYCVKFTCLDAIQLGYNVYLIEDACRGVNIRPEDSQKALEEMLQAGVNIIRSNDIDQIINS